MESANSSRAWVGVVCQTHVERGVDGGFAQLCHGRAQPLRRMQPGDWLVYYSPGVSMRAEQPLRAFTALGRIADAEVVRFDMGGGFVPFRRTVRYLPTRLVPVGPLRRRLAFVRDNPNWGWLARRGHFEIDLADLAILADAMLLHAADRWACARELQRIEPLAAPDETGPSAGWNDHIVRAARAASGPERRR